jgi:hypothetical protein
MKIVDLFESSENLDDVLKGYKKNLSILVEKDLILWRGIQGHLKNSDEISGELYQEFESRERQSRLGVNFNMHLINSWAASHDLPDRAKSVFCSTTQSGVGTFGRPCLIIPHDSVKSFAYAPLDVNRYDSKREMKTDVLDIFGIILELARQISVTINATSTQNYKTTIRLIELIEPHGAREFLIDLRDKKPLGKIGTSILIGFFDSVLNDDVLSKSIKKDKASSHAIDVLDSILTELKLRLLKLNISSIQEIKKVVFPSDYGITTSNSLNGIKFSDKNSKAVPAVFDELWFEGKYLLISVRKTVDQETIKSLRDRALAG